MHASCVRRALRDISAGEHASGPTFVHEASSRHTITIHREHDVHRTCRCCSFAEWSRERWEVIVSERRTRPSLATVARMLQ
jgi:hypothetical protein